MPRFGFCFLCTSFVVLSRFTQLFELDRQITNRFFRDSGDAGSDNALVQWPPIVAQCDGTQSEAVLFRTFGQWKKLVATSSSPAGCMRPAAFVVASLVQAQSVSRRLS